MIYLFGLSVVLAVFLSDMAAAYAVPPPDFVFAVGTQLVQVFSLFFLFLSAAAGATYRYLQAYIADPKHRRILLAFGIVVVLAVSLIGAYLYDNYRQKQEHDKWLEESNKQTQSVEKVELEKSDKDEEIELTKTIY